MKLKNCDVTLTPKQVWEVVSNFAANPWPYTPPGSTPPIPEPVKVPITERVKSWEDAANIIKPLWYATYGKQYIEKDTSFDDAIIPLAGFMNVSSEARAKSVSAYAKLSVIADALNSESIPSEYRWSVTHDLKGVSAPIKLIRRLIEFNNEELAMHSLATFRQLWADYYMLDLSYPPNKVL